MQGHKDARVPLCNATKHEGVQLCKAQRMQRCTNAMTTGSKRAGGERKKIREEILVI